MASEDDKPVAKLLAAIRKSVRMFPPGIIKDVRCTVRENISITRQTKRLSSVTCCKGLPMKHCAILFSSSSATWKMPCSDTNLSETTNTSPSIGCGCATRCTASKRWKSVSARHVSGKSRKASKRCPSAGSTYQRGDSLFRPDVAPRIFFQDTAPLPQYQVLSASRKPVDKRAAKQNLHRHL